MATEQNPNDDLFIASPEGTLNTRLEETTWVEKFKAAKKITWLPDIYAESDYAQDFENSIDFQIDEEEQKKIKLEHTEVWAKDLLDSNSQEEFEFKQGRAKRAKESYKQLGGLGYGSVSALIAAGVTDPALLPLWFVPYARLGAGAKALQGASRYMHYAKTGAVIGGAEGLAVSSAEYMLRPDAQAKDVLFGVTLGAGIGGAMGAVAGRLRRDIDAEHFEANAVDLTPKGKEKFEGHTPAEKQARVVDALTDEGDLDAIPVPKAWDDAADVSIPQRQLDDILAQGLRGGATQIRKLRAEINRRANSRKTYMVGGQQVTQQNFGKRLFGVTDGTNTAYFKRTKDGTYRSNEKGELLEKIGAEKFSRGNASRRVLGFKSKSRVEELKKDADNMTFTEQKLAENDRIAAGDLKPEDVPRLKDTVFNKLRLRNVLSSISRTTQSQTAAVRALGIRMGLASGALVNATGKMVKAPFNALTRSHQFQTKYNTLITKVVVNAEKNSNLRSKEVREHLGQALNNPNHGVPVELQPFVKELKDIIEDMHEKAVKSGVFEGSNKIESYFPRIFRADYIDRVIEKMGGRSEATATQMKEAFKELIIDALPEKSKPRTTEETKKIYSIASAYWSTLSSIDGRNKLTRTAKYAGKDFNSDEDTLKKTLREALEDEEVKVTDEELDRVLYALNPEQKAKAKNVHARSRMLINDTKVIKLADKNGEEFDFKLTDLVEKDVYTAMNIYTHRMGGSIALAEQGIDSVEGVSFSSLIAKLGTEATEQEIKSLEFMYQTLRGSTGINETMDLSTSVLLRRVRDFNFIRMMGMSGLAALAEVPNVMFENGIRHFLTNVPAIPSMIGRLKADGELRNALVREVEIGNGLGADVFTGSAIARFDDTSDDISRLSQTHGKLDEGLAHGRRMVSLMSGLTPVTVFLQRLHQYNTVTKFYKELVTKGNLGVYHPAKLKQLNLDEDMLKRVQTEMKKNGKLKGKRLETINAKDWTDREAADAFEYALFLDTTQVVQLTNASSINPFFNSVVGKSAFQFWSFPVAATEQQYARQTARLAEGDLRPLAMISGSLGVATLSYIARAAINANGKDDPDKYFAEKMEIGNLARGGASGIGFLGVGSFAFNYGGVDPASLVQNPTIQLGSGIYNNAVDGDVMGMIGSFNPNNPLLGAPFNMLDKSLGN